MGDKKTLALMQKLKRDKFLRSQNVWADEAIEILELISLTPSGIF